MGLPDPNATKFNWPVQTDLLPLWPMIEPIKVRYKAKVNGNVIQEKLTIRNCDENGKKCQDFDPQHFDTPSK